MNMKHRQIGSRAAFDAMMGPTSFESMFWLAKKPFDNPDAFAGRISLLVPIGRHQQPIPEPEPEFFDHHDLPLLRGMLIGRVLSARTPEGCERANALIDEWLAVFPEDMEVAGYSSFVARMWSAIRAGEER